MSHLFSRYFLENTGHTHAYVFGGTTYFPHTEGQRAFQSFVYVVQSIIPCDPKVRHTLKVVGVRLPNRQPSRHGTRFLHRPKCHDEHKRLNEPKEMKLRVVTKHRQSGAQKQRSPSGDNSRPQHLTGVKSHRPNPTQHNPSAKTVGPNAPSRQTRSRPYKKPGRYHLTNQSPEQSKTLTPTHPKNTKRIRK